MLSVIILDYHGDQLITSPANRKIPYVEIKSLCTAGARMEEEKTATTKAKITLKFFILFQYILIVSIFGGSELTSRVVFCS